MARQYIWAIIKRPGEQPEERLIPNELREYQRRVGGYVEAVGLDGGAVLLCNEEGKLRGMPHNVTLPGGEEIVGTAVIVGMDGDEFVSCPMRVSTVPGAEQESRRVTPWLWEVETDA